VEIRHVAAYSDYVGNDPLQDLLRKNLEKVIPIGYTEEELEYARRFQKVISDLDRDGLKKKAKRIGGKNYESVLNQPVWDFVLPDQKGGGSTDVGDVSWVCPTGWFHAATWAAGTPGHNWQVVAQGKSAIAHKGMIASAKVLAVSAYELLISPETIKEAKKDWLEKLDGETYPGALPKEAKPEIW